ncbi:MAG: SUMF1/EgtB/PvdO family nonheme iron enzyme [Chlorobium sp.]|nr:SUMF1/EgtB/PvdO family nonheme iron enzyme [Chlorobium sp.]
MPRISQLRIVSVLLAVLVTGLLAVTPALAAKKGLSVKPKTVKTESSGSRRLALIIGNSAYRHSGTLANPARDAELMAQTLKSVGFDIYGGGAQTNLTRIALDQAIEAFGNQIHAGDVALFYYSGHGLQVDGKNYLVPVDADIKKEAEVRVKTVPVNLLFAKLEDVPGAVNIVILDACRNNPFARSFRSSGGGLASVSAPTGTLVAFSTAPGQVAEDGNGKNSSYTRELAKYVTEPGLRVEDVFKKVRASVGKSTKGNQTPWENTSLTGDFAFIEGDALELKKAALTAAGDAKKGELDALLKMEAEANRQKAKEQAEIDKREAAVTRMDAEITAMKKRLGSGSVRSNDSLKNMVAMVTQREGQAQRLEQLRKEREAEEQKRQAEIARLKTEAESKRKTAIEADISDYEKIVNSPYGKDLADEAWMSLVSKYPDASEIDKGNLVIFRQVVVDGLSLSKLKLMTGTFIRVPGGCFQMGDTFGGGDDDEKPVHEICISDFAIGKYEVTQWQWQKVMGNNPSHFNNCGDDCPVEQVSWNDVQKFIVKLNNETGAKYRLPTEAEWEYAARSGGKLDRYSGGDNVDAVAWHLGNSDSKTHRVGQKLANGLGIYDMSGNVWEWVSDWYGSYSGNRQQDPQRPASGSDHVDRGGGWGNGAKYVRSAVRGGVVAGDFGSSLGFRLALSSVR